MSYGMKKNESLPSPIRSYSVIPLKGAILVQGIVSFSIIKLDLHFDEYTTKSY